MTSVNIKLGVSCILCIWLQTSAWAKPEYAMKEGKACLYCHVRPGEDRNFRGLFYAANEHSFSKFEEDLEAKLAGVKVDSMGPDGRPINKKYPARLFPPVLDLAAKDIEGKTVNLGRYWGDVLLVINIATLDSVNAGQLVSLDRLMKKYKGRGFQILAFPCNDFNTSEPGSDGKIKSFLRQHYDATYQVFSKITIQGEKATPLYKFLTSKIKNPEHGGDIEGNFVKFLINRKGEVVGRWRSGVDPASDRIGYEIDKALSYPKRMVIEAGG